RLRNNKALTGALSAITAAVVGIILNLTIWFAVHTLFRHTVPVSAYGLVFDAPVPASLAPWPLALAACAALAIFRFKIGMLATLAGAAAAGALLRLAGLIG
ncbi:MAG: chromate transporter, partial [Rhodoblastus sp.]